MNADFLKDGYAGTPLGFSCGNVRAADTIRPMIDQAQTRAPRDETDLADSEEDLRELDRVMTRAREEIARKAKLRDERFRRMLHEIISRVAAEKA